MIVDLRCVVSAMPMYGKHDVKKCAEVAKLANRRDYLILTRGMTSYFWIFAGDKHAFRPPLAVLMCAPIYSNFNDTLHLVDLLFHQRRTMTFIAFR